MKRAIAFVLFIAALMGLLAGCGDTKKRTDPFQRGMDHTVERCVWYG